LRTLRSHVSTSAMPHSEFLDFALTQVLRIIQQTNERLVQVMVIAQNTRGCPSEIRSNGLLASGAVIKTFIQRLSGAATLDGRTYEEVEADRTATGPAGPPLPAPQPNLATTGPSY
jgi:hypothetical protein